MKNIRFVFVTLLLVGSIGVNAQQNIKIDKKDFNIEEQGFDEAWEHVKEAEKLFSKGIGTYGDALEQYEIAAAYNTYNPQLNYKMGVCCLYSERKLDALNNFKRAYEFNNNVASDIHLMLGRAYHFNHDFERAIEEYKTHRDSLTEKERKKNKIDFDKLIRECENGIALMEKIVSAGITNLGDAINSPYDDYNPLITSSGNRMYFTSRRASILDDRRNLLDNKFNEDIYVSFFRNNRWEEAQNVGKKINSEYNEAALSITDGDSLLYIYYGNSNNGDIFISEFKKGQWNNPRKMSGKFNSGQRETTLSFDAHKKTVYFISASKKNTLGGTDIFVSRKDEKDKWGRPENIGPIINTPFDEEAVFLHPDGTTLFFSSKGHNSMGGFDIFKSILLPDGEWSVPQNIGFPINSAGDDLFYTTYNDSTSAYISSMREDSYGMMDIYKVSYIPELVYDDILSEAEEYPEVELEWLAFLDEVPVVEIDKSILLKGIVTDREDSVPVMARLEIIDMDINDVIATSISDKESGSYSIRLEEKKNYGVEITSQGYMVFLDIINIPPDTEASEMISNFALQKVKVGEKVILKNIFFELNKATLTAASYEELGRVLKLLESNPTLRIEISGHTDNVGSFQVNQRLSEARAKAVVDYLIGNGTDPDRLEYAGYAFSRPVATNDTAEGRAQNRRVEFEILSK